MKFGWTQASASLRRPPTTWSSWRTWTSSSRRGGRLRSGFRASVSPGPSRPGTTLSQLPASDRLEGSLAGAVWALLNGAAMVRAHDVKATVDAAKLVGVK